MAVRRRRASHLGFKTEAVGLIIDRPNEFFKEMCSALQKTLDLRHARTVCHQVGSREIRYVCEANPVHVLGLGKPVLALPLHSSGQQAWLVVEVEYEAGQPALLQQVSLKVLQGPTTDTATLCFRAEWDMRNQASNHAQPHWNVHMPTLAARVEEVQQGEENFSEFAERQEPPTFASFAAKNDLVAAKTASVSAATTVVSDQSATLGFTPEQMHRFHFAMAVDWHGKTGMHSPALPNPEQMVKWIAECAKYVRGQFAYMA